ncbi:PKD domain-containing protein [Streptomyces sp. MB09-01]|uniref:PKD domain-containing protein n=1 Tax=Streptomyces sp. MB09-01 TaxID=3028666 RepID=UPI0029ABE82D|nr:PKD domain-containing protein [Streptomyces sp. MB09-01]MDX3536136.1 PKD domain-containing protein [Streptomyces sp. MB09-01]
MAAGVALLPGTTAHAAPLAPAAGGVSVPAGGASKGASASLAGGVDKAREAAAKTFRSPADRSVRSALPAGGNKAAGAQAQSVAGNPDLALAIEGVSYTAYGLMIDSTITSADVPVELTIDWGDGKVDKQSLKGSTVHGREHVYAKLGTYNVTVTVTDAANGVQAVNTLPFSTLGSDFTPHAPTRLLDTRNGTGAVAGKVAGRGTARVKVAGNAKVPAGVTAVVLNVTVTNTIADGHVTAFPGKGSVRPITSNLNYTAGQSVPNLAIVPVGTDGYVELFNGGWSPVDLIADVTGYFTPSEASGYTSLSPVRAVDTREGLGTAKGQVPGQGSFEVQISGKNGVPAGIKAVALNMTVTNPREDGHLIAYPSGQQAPITSNVNFTAGQTVANAVIVPVGPDGKIAIRNGAWAGADVVVDVVGYYSPDSAAAFLPIGPFRALDTRDPESWWPGGHLPARGYIPQMASAEPAGVEAYALNATVTETKDSGFLSVAPGPFPWLVNDGPDAPQPPRPNSSVLNWTAGRTVPNLVQASDGEHGIIHFWNQGWKDADLIVDVFGVYETR